MLSISVMAFKTYCNRAETPKQLTFMHNQSLVVKDIKKTHVLPKSNSNLIM
jgi:hypothetical protein